MLSLIVLALSLLLSTVIAAPSIPLHHIHLLSAHNLVRAAHGANPLKWSHSLAGMAATWANSCILENTNGFLSSQPYGENLAAGTGDFNAEAAVGLFIQDESTYHPSNPTYNHFTQVVWKATTSMGCGVATCDNLFYPPRNATYYVCLYDPPGNVVGQAPQNVQI